MARNEFPRNEDFEDGELVIDAHGNVAQKSYFGTGGWFILGLTDEERPFEELVQPVRRLVPASPAPVRGKADPYLYRITYNNGKVKHGHRRVLGPVLGAMREGGWYKQPVKIERAPEPDWQDVTSEHIPS